MSSSGRGEALGKRLGGRVGAGEVRDALRFRRVDAAKVTTWAAAAGSYLEKFEIKPGEQATRSYDCVVPRDYKSILFGGHMHEWGKKFVLSYAATPASTC